LLEQRWLLLRPWAVEATPAPCPDSPPLEPGRRLRIVDPDTGQLLGFAAPGQRKRTWLSWLGRRTIFWVFEAEDEPLLLGVDLYWHWGWSLEVRDADGQHVGRISGNRLFDRFDRFLASMQPSSENGALLFQRSDGTEIGTATSTPDGLLLTFDLTLEGKPFPKMLLLAAVLCNHCGERRGVSPPV
jgi:hypothetical protein